jgi:prepilin-type N-terminal cleavage/methylation domain-containing protein
MIKNSRKSAFTLVEMAIVIVIVAVIIAGIFSGQEILEGSKRLAVISELNNYKTSYEQFEEKYYSVPGDMVDATSVWSSADGNGDGDGTIERGGNNEDYLAWQHLALSGFIDGSFDGSMSGSNVELETEIPKGPYIKSGYRMIRQNEKTPSSDYYNAVTLGKVRSGHNVDTALFTPRQAHSIDQKIDDINPSEGNLVTIAGNGVTATDCVTANGAGDEDDTYTLTNDDVDCILVYYMEHIEE